MSTLPFVDKRIIDKNKIKIGNDWIKHTLKVWEAVKKVIRGPGSISRAMPIVGNIDFSPSISDNGFKRWASKGLITINQLFNNTVFKSFAQLQTQFRLPSSNLFRYLQIRHYVTEHRERELVSEIPNNIEDYFIGIAENNFPTRKHVSNLYKALDDISQNTGTLRINGNWN